MSNSTRFKPTGTETDKPVVVCGAGAAGMAASLAASRSGARVHLIESQSRPGGTVVHALIHTLAGLYDSAGEYINDGLARELAEALIAADSRTRKRRIGRTWVLNVSPAVYLRVVTQWLNRETRITTWYNSCVSEIVRTGHRIGELLVSSSSGSDTIRLFPKAIVDATGSAEVVRSINPHFLQDNGQCAAGGLIVVIKGVRPGAVAFPNGLAVIRSLRHAAADGRLSAACEHTWIDSGVDEDEVYVKLSVPVPPDWRTPKSREQVIAEAMEMKAEIVSFLTQFPEFARARVSRTGTLGLRDAGRVRGEYLLNQSDVLEARKFSDPACRCCWPIEYWHPETGVSLDYLSPGSYYEVPMRSLKLPGLENVWCAGKCLSADRYAQASARVVGCCWSMGEAVGRVAAAPLPAENK